jgi:hypothetical protein
MAKRVLERLPSPPQITYDNLLHMHLLEIPHMTYFVGLCQPFAAALQDLHKNHANHATSMLHSAIQAFASAPPPVPAIMSHSLFSAFPIASPLVVELIQYIRNAKVKFCHHCVMQLEQYAYFVREHNAGTNLQHPPLWNSFHRNQYEVDYIKEQQADLPKISPLGNPQHLPLKYDPKLLTQAVIETAPHPTTTTVTVEPTEQHFSVGSEIFGGELVRRNTPIFSLKVWLSLSTNTHVHSRNIKRQQSTENRIATELKPPPSRNTLLEGNNRLFFIATSC